MEVPPSLIAIAALFPLVCGFMFSVLLVIIVKYQAIVHQSELQRLGTLCNITFHTAFEQ